MAADLAAVDQALAEARRQPLDVVEGRPLSVCVCLYSVKMELASQRGLILRSFVRPIDLCVRHGQVRSLCKAARTLGFDLVAY